MIKQEITISNRIIRKLNPCYDPSEVVKDENEKLPVREWVLKYRSLVKDPSDIVWLLCNEYFMSDKDLRLFAVWNARKALALVENPDIISLNACNIAERFANGEATREELLAAEDGALDAWAAREDADWNTTKSAARATARASTLPEARTAAWSAARNNARTAYLNAAKDATKDDAINNARYAARSEQLDQLLTYFN